MREYREARGISQKNLAAHLGKMKSWLCEVEQGRIRVTCDRAPRKRYFGTVKVPADHAFPADLPG